MMNPLIIHSLCWTFIHSLWQGLIVAIIAGIAIQSTIHEKASVRYNILLLLFMAFIVSTGCTFISYCQDDIAFNATAKEAIIISNAYFSTEDNHQTLQWSDFINQHTNTIFALWALFFIINIFNLGKDVITVRQLKNSGSSLISQEWINRFDDLCNKMNIHKVVQFRSTSIIQSPMLIGYFKPVILLPLAMFSDLTPLQIEAIILHELAHIKRHDFVVNAIQRLVVCIFFFNPFIRWISVRIDAEREYCCDAYALSSEQSKVDYVQSLLYFNMQKTNYGNLVLRFLPTRMHLLQRVQRIFNNKNNELMNIEKTFLAASILFTTFSSIVYFGKPSTISNVLTAKLHTPMALDTLKPLGQGITKTSTLPLSTNSIVRKGDTISVPGEGIFYFKNMDVTQMSDTDILEKIQLYNTAEIEHGQAMVEHEKSMEQHHIAMIEHDAAMVQHDAAMEEHDAAMLEHKAAQAIHEEAMRGHQQEMSAHVSAIASQQDAMQQATQQMSSATTYMTEAEMKKMEAEMKQMERENRKIQKEMLKMEKEQLKQQKEMLKMEKEQQKHQKEMAKMEKELDKEMKKQDQAAATIKAIIESLIADKIIVSAEKVSFLLSEKEFIVNDVKQSKDVWQKYYKKYSKGKISYAHNYNFEIKDK